LQTAVSHTHPKGQEAQNVIDMHAIVSLAKELHFILKNKFILGINSVLYKKDCLLSVLTSQI